MIDRQGGERSVAERPIPPAATLHRRSWLWRIATSLVVLVVISVVVVLYSRYRQLHRPVGTLAATPAPEQCRLDPATLAQTHTHAPEKIIIAGPAEFPQGGDLNVQCYWGQALGRDGINPRHLMFQVLRYHAPNGWGSAGQQYDTESQLTYAMGRRTDTAVPGLGDEAVFAVTTDRVDRSRMRLVVRQGNLLVEVFLEGEDRHAFWTTQMSTVEAQRLSIAVARELLQRKW